MLYEYIRWISSAFVVFFVLGAAAFSLVVNN